MAGENGGMPVFDPGAMGGGGGSNTGPSAQQAVGGNFLAGGKQPVVYWGGTAKNTNTRDSSRDEVLAASGFNRRGIREVPLQEAAQDFYNWSDSERQAWAQRLYGLGAIQDPHDMFGPQGAFAKWQDAVQQASNFYMVAGKKVTPWQMVDIMAGGAHGPGNPKPTTNTSTSQSFQIPTVEDAHAAAKSVTQALLGRDPDNHELDRLASIMVGYAKKNPSITKTTQHNDGTGNITSSSTSSGGYTAAGMQNVLQDKVQADPEYGAYQSATTYWGALMGALGLSEHG